MRTRKNTNGSGTLPLIALLAVLLAACGGGADDPAGSGDAAGPSPDATEMSDEGDMETPMDDMTSDDDMDMGDDDMDMGMSGDYGEPADASEADRTVEVNVDDDLAFEPAEFEAGVGEVITFQISNTGSVEHEFVLGDQEAQDQMAEMMDSEEGDHAHSGEMTNAVTIHPGETAELTWRFTTEGTVLIGCHVPGHWEAGMQGEVTVG